MKKQWCLLFFLVCMCLSVQGQLKLFTPPTGSSDKLYIPKKFGEKQWAFVFGFNPRWSFYQKSLVKMQGIRFGAEYNGVHRFGIGVHGLFDRIKFAGIPITDPFAPADANVSFNARYLTAFYERSLLKTARWDVSVPTEFAYGRLKAFYELETQNYIQYMDDPFIALISGLQVRFYVFSWLIPRIGAGYRYSILKDQEVELVFNRPYITFGLQVVVGDLYQKVFPKKIKN